MLPNEIVELLEARRNGRLREDDTEKLRAALAERPDSAAEVAAFERLWDGFDALRHEEQTARFATFDQDWKSTDDTELIEWYLSGELSPENTAWIEKRKKADPAFATVLTEQQTLHQGFAAAREETFRQNLQRWDEGAASTAEAKTVKLRPRWVRTLAVAAGVLILLVAGTLIYNAQSPDPPAIVASYYKSPPIGNTLGAADDPADAYLSDFAAAHRLMKKGDYVEAYTQLSGLSTQPPPADFSDEDVKYYQDNIDWNLVLALVGKAADPEMTARRLDRILADPGHTYYTEAVELKEEL